MPGQSAEVALPQPRLLAAVSRATPAGRRAESPTAARSGPKAASARSCKQQLSFRPKAFRRRDLAAGPRTPESCKQQLSSGASLDSAMSPPNDNVLLTGSAWRGGFRNISHDATGPRPAGRIEEGKEGSSHTAASSGRDRPDRAACSPAVEAVESQRRQGRRPCATRPAI